MTDAGALATLRTRLAPADCTDGQLLTAFVNHYDGEAFAALVHRLGPRVLAVCRRITGHAHDADDAFQAVFLVLARRAAVVNPPEAVAGWVYGVAVRTAQDARTMAARRRSRITPTAAIPDTPVTPLPSPDDDHIAILDDEIARLPDHLRAAVVLCELDGVSRKDAAARLGIAEGTLSSRLANARKRLAVALVRRGVVLAAVLVASASTVSGSAPLFASASRWGSLVAAGERVPAGVLTTLADRASRIMLLNKLKPLVIATTVGLIVLAVGWRPLTALVAADPPVVKAEPAKPAKPLNKLVVWKQNVAVMIDPDGKNEKVLFDLEKWQSIREPKLSPDGKTLAYLTHVLDPKDSKPDDPQVHSVAFREVGGKDATVLKVSGVFVAWSPDGKELVATYAPDGGGPKDGPAKATTTVIEVATKKDTVVALPDGHVALGFAPDGSGFLTMNMDLSGKKPVISACLISRDGKTVKTLSDPDHIAYMPQLSLDGKTLLFMGMKAPDAIPDKPLDVNPRLCVQPIGGKVMELPDVPQNAQIQGYCWSPDGKKIAYSWRQIHEDKTEEGKVDERETESHLVICDADGKNAKTIVTEKGQGQAHITLGSICWR